MNETGIGILLFGAAGAVCIGYATYQVARLIQYRDRIRYTNATIVDTVSAAPEAMKIRNSRWAYVQYWVDGKEYIPPKRIQVSMKNSIGDTIEIGYFKDEPSIIFTPRWKSAITFFVIGILCWAILILLINKG